MGDNVLVLGSGGREHALAWKIAQSPSVNKVYCAPGNGGTSNNAININMGVNDFDEIAKFVTSNNINLTVVGPEDPLVNGIVDYFVDNGLEKYGHKIFGPNQKAAMIEGSKVFAKEFMKRHNIPTADFKVFSNYSEAINYVKIKKQKIVLKADGVAAGKGAIVCSDYFDARDALNRIMINREFKQAGDKVVIEDFLEGEEASVLALTDGVIIQPLISSQDHKQLEDGDKGPNTGGMGAYAPAPIVTPEVMKKVYDQIIAPTIYGLKEEGITFKGCLYAGLMIKDGEPNVLEFNVRFGDPETQAILPMINGIYSSLKGCADKTLHLVPSILYRGGAACSVVMASGGYPSTYRKGYTIEGIGEAESLDDVVIFHAGTKRQNGQLTTSGGRVLAVTAYGKEINEAIAKAYAGVEKIKFQDSYSRKDIGFKALRQ